MRVLIDAVTAPGDPRGVGRYIRELSASAAAIDDTHVVLAHGRWHSEFFAPLATRGVELVPVDLRSRGRLARHWWHASSLSGLARRVRADVIHVPDRVPATPRAGPPVIATIHDVAEYDQPDAFGPVQRHYRRLILDRQLRTAHRLITPSDFSAQRMGLVNLAARTRTTVVHSGPGLDPDTQPSKPTAPIREPFLLVLGAVQRHKNVPRVIRAFRRIDGRDISLVVAGADHNDRGSVARATEGDTRVVRLRDPADAEVAWLYRHAAGLFFPSLYEGFGLPILEAMAFGCPVITSDRGAMQELGKGAAMLVDPFDEEALHHAALRLLDDATLARHLVAAGRERATQYSWERAATSTVAVYRDALDGAA